MVSWNGATEADYSPYTPVVNMSKRDLIGDIIDPRHAKYGAKFDGVTDDTVALRAAFNDLPTDNGVIIIRGGTAVTKRIVINNKNNLRVIFDNAKLLATTNAPDTGAGDAGVLLVFANCTNLTIRNAYLDGNRANIASLASGTTNRGVQVALKISNCTKVTVDNPRIVESVQDALSGSTTKQLNIINPILENIGENGIYFSTGSEDISIVGGTYKNIGASGDWGNILQFRHDCQRISITGGAATQAYGGIALTEGITDVSINGFVGTELGKHISINSAGDINLVNDRIKLVGCVFKAKTTPIVALNSNVFNFDIVGCLFSGPYSSIGGFDTFIGSTVDGFSPGTGNPALILKAKARVLGSVIKNITGRGIEVQAVDSGVFSTQFDTLSDIAIRILVAATGFRHGDNRYTAVTGGPLFDSTTNSTISTVFSKASASATAVGTLTKKQELFDHNGVSIGFIPIYSSIT